MRPRTLLVLFVVVAGLAAFIWFYERELPSSDERRQQAKRALTVEADEVTAVVIERGGEVVRLERAPAEGEADESSWRLVEPIAARADAVAVDGLVAELTGLERSRSLTDVEAAAVGLDEPRAIVTLETAAGGERLLIGSEIPAATEMIVARDGARGFLVVPAAAWEDLAREAGEWRSRDVFPGTREQIERLRLTREGLDLVLARRGGRFWIESPLADLADDERVSALLGKIVALRAERFVDPAESLPAEIGLEPPAAVVEVVRADGEAFRIELGAAAGDGKRYCRAEGQVFVAPRPVGDALEQVPGEWQARTWTPLEAYQIDAVTVADAAGTTAFEREGGDWRRGEHTVPYNAMNDLLYAITGASAERILTPAEAAGLGVDREAATLAIDLASGEEVERLELFAAVASGHPAAAAGREHVLLFSDATVADLELKLEEARTATQPSVDEEPPEA